MKEYNKRPSKEKVRETIEKIIPKEDYMAGFLAEGGFGGYMALRGGISLLCGNTAEIDYVSFGFGVICLADAINRIHKMGKIREYTDVLKEYIFGEDKEETK